MTKIWPTATAVTAIGALTLTGCGTRDDAAGDDRLHVVSSFAILSDIVEEVGGADAAVHHIVQVGGDPHDYEESPCATKSVTDASTYCYNGRNLDAGEHVANGLSEDDPDNADTYQDNLDAYLDELEDMDQQYQEKIGGLDEDRRILVTSERAYQYMADRYDLTEGYIWAVDTDEIGTPEQTISAIDFVKEHNPPALFVESNVNPDPMETVSEETGVDIYATIFSDELAPEGEPGDTYLSFLEENLNDISEGLSQ